MTAGSIQSASARESLQGLFGAAQGGLERLPLLRQALERTGPACAEEARAMAAAAIASRVPPRQYPTAWTRFAPVIAVAAPMAASRPWMR